VGNFELKLHTLGRFILLLVKRALYSTTPLMTV